MIQPLDLKTILVNYLAGSWEIFFFLAMIFLVFLAAKFRMPNHAVILMTTVFISIVSFQFSAIWTVVILLVGLFISLVLSRTLKQ